MKGVRHWQQSTEKKIGVAWWCETCGIGKLGNEQLVGQFFVRAVRQRWKVACQRDIFVRDILAPILFLYYLKNSAPEKQQVRQTAMLTGQLGTSWLHLDHRGIGLWLEYVGAIVWGEISSHGSWDYNQCMELVHMFTWGPPNLLDDHLEPQKSTWDHREPPGTT